MTTLSEDIRARLAKEVGTCPTCGRTGGGTKKAAQEMGLATTTLWRFLGGKPVNSDHLDMIANWLNNRLNCPQPSQEPEA